MRENFLHHIWRWRKFACNHLETTEKQALQILHTGEHNTHAGPDFFNARLIIGETQWAANVEIHVFASEWEQHQHNQDPAYQNVALHVVWEEDKIIYLPNGQRLPCLELKNRIPEQIHEHFEQLTQSKLPIPCAVFLHQMPEIVRLNWLDRLLVERLERKTSTIAAAIEKSENHWEAVFYQHLAGSFGLKINVLPFENLAHSLPVQILGKHKNNLFQIEALLFGQAGLLENPTDDYQQSLAKEYHFLSNKYQLLPLPAGSWKFLRLRPANFPTVRLAQFAMLIHRAEHLFPKTLEMTTLREMHHLFDVGVSEYWLTHYRFGKLSPKRNKQVGKQFAELLLLNTVIPFIFLYGKEKNKPDLKDRALHFLEKMPPEKNSLLEDWDKVGWTAKHGFEAQALLELRKNFCDKKRCLDCAVGHYILR